MFVFIRLKKLIFVFVGIMLVLTFWVGNYKEIIPVTAIPLSEPTYTIVIDAGHGEPDGGAVSNDGVKEANINLEIAKKLEEALDELGYNVIMTREDENNIADKDKQTSIKQIKVSDLNNRVKIVNSSKADMCISIHLNKFSSEKYYGWQTFYNKSSEYNKILAEEVQKGLSEKIDRKNERVALCIKDVKLTDKAEIPTTIVECGFLSNIEEASLLQTEEYQTRIVEGIILGISRYYEKIYKTT